MSKEKTVLYRLLKDIKAEDVGHIEFTPDEYRQLQNELRPSGAKLGIFVLPPKTKKKTK